MTAAPHAMSMIRSEAFAEDLAGLVAESPRELAVGEVYRERRWLRRLSLWLPLAVALAGVAFAVVPPLA